MPLYHMPGVAHFPKHSLEYSLNFWSQSKKKILTTTVARWANIPPMCLQPPPLHHSDSGGSTPDQFRPHYTTHIALKDSERSIVVEVECVAGFFITTLLPTHTTHLSFLQLGPWTGLLLQGF